MKDILLIIASAPSELPHPAETPQQRAAGIEAMMTIGLHLNDAMPQKLAGEVWDRLDIFDRIIAIEGCKIIKRNQGN